VDRLSDIPVQQQLVLGLLLVLLMAGGFYFLAITPLEESIASSQGRYRNFAQEYKKLEQYKQAGKMEELLEAEEREKAKIEENKTLLPTEAELPEFIQGIKVDADSVDLVIHKFEVGTEVIEDYYKKIPIDVRAVGTFNQLISFFKTISAPSKRTVNIKDIKIERLELSGSKLKSMVSDNEILDSIDSQKNRARNAKTPEQKRYLSILELAQKNKRSYVDANFTIFAFSYTGEPMPAALRNKRAKSRKSKKARH